MDKAKFTFYNVVGSISWVVSMIFAGHFLQKWIFDAFGFDLKQHLEIIVLGIVFVTTAPVLWKLFFSKKKAAAPPNSASKQ
jgi:membrane-associated protein